MPSKERPTAVRFPPGVVADIDKAAKHVGLSRNAWIVKACKLGLSLSTAPEFEPGPETKPTKDHGASTVGGYESSAREASELALPPSGPAPGAAVPVVEIESRPVAGMHQWRVKGEDEPSGTVPYRREIEADARRKLAERFGHPVEVRHK